jgi:glutathione S-transferase
MTKPELISFKLCPFVRRSVITLIEKGIEYDIKYIQLDNKPEWFLEMSPLGKVPVLNVGGTVLFESAVINEYLDETTEPRFHPEDALLRARHKALIELGSALLMDLYVVSTTKDTDTFKARKSEVERKLSRFEGEVSGKFFSGDSLCLVDTALAPALHHLELLDDAFNHDFFANFPKLKSWWSELAQLKSVNDSVVDEFKDLWNDYYNKPFHAIARSK